jgi:UDP-glucose 4-epimerase
VRIVITGATGNVGSAVVRRLLADGHDLTGVVRRPPEGDAIAHPDEVAWVSADLSTDASVSVLRDALTGADAVVHLVWGFQPSHRLDYLEEVGVGGTQRVLTAIGAADVPHLVHLSSVGAYSPKQDDVPVTEDYPTGGVPTSPYSRHKAAAERILDTFERDHPGTTVTRMRPGIIGQERAGSSLLRYALPAVVPSAVVGLLPVLPVDRSLLVPSGPGTCTCPPASCAAPCRPAGTPGSSPSTRAGSTSRSACRSSTARVPSASWGGCQ